MLLAVFKNLRCKVWSPSAKHHSALRTFCFVPKPASEPWALPLHTASQTFEKSSSLGQRSLSRFFCVRPFAVGFDVLAHLGYSALVRPQLCVSREVAELHSAYAVQPTLCDATGLPHCHAYDASTAGDLVHKPGHASGSYFRFGFPYLTFSTIPAFGACWIVALRVREDVLEVVHAGGLPLHVICRLWLHMHCGLSLHVICRLSFHIQCGPSRGPQFHGVH